MAQQNQERQQSREIAPIERLAPPRLPITQSMMTRLDVTDAAWRVLTDSIFPSARTVEGIALALSWSRSKDFDIMLRPCHVVPMWSAAQRKYVETVWPSIFYFRAIAHRTSDYAGIDAAVLGPMIEEEFVQVFEADERDPRSSSREVKRTVKYPEWIELTVHRFVKGEKCSFTATVYWKETYATAGRNTDVPNDIWLKRPISQLEKCAEAAVLRRAFTEQLGNDYIGEEMEGKVIEHEATLERPASTRPAPPKPGPRPTDAKIVDAVVEDVVEEQQGGEPFNFDELVDRLLEAPDEATVLEVWEHSGAVDALKGDAPAMTRALQAKTKRLRQIRETEPVG
jgi:phage recombination protein Bet